MGNGRLRTRKAVLDRNVCVNMLVYGRTGVGKTTLLGTAEECEFTSPTLFVAADPGILSIAGSGIDVITPEDFTEIQEIYEYLRFDNTKYKSVCIDSLTVAQRTSMYGIIGVLEDGSYGKLDETVPPDRYDWLSSGEQMRRFISAFRDLAYLKESKRRIHVFFAANEKVDDKTGYLCPSLPGTLATEIGAHVDMLARLTKEEAETDREEEIGTYRHLQLDEEIVETGATVMAKVRTPWKTSVPSEMWEPTVDKILKVWFRGVKKGRRKVAA